MLSQDSIEFTAQIENIAYGGDGVARYNGKVIFIPGVITGETVKASVYHSKKRFDLAICAEILEKSPHRLQPLCPLVVLPGKNPLNESCRGCQYQIIDYNFEIEVKKSQLEKFLAKFAELDSFPEIHTIPSPIEYQYRNKISLSIGIDKSGRKFLGYVSGDNRTVIEVKHCPIAAKEINQYLAEMTESKVQSLRKNDSIFLRFSQKSGVIEWNLLSGPSKQIISEPTPIGDILTPAGSFFQVNIRAGEILFNPVYEIIKEIKPDCVLDLYCGAGIFALLSASAGTGKVFGVETDKLSIECAKKNAENLHLNAQFIAKSAEKYAPKLLNEVKTQRSMIIVDPPRCGLDSRLINAIIETPPKFLLYISCGPDTFARDLKTLKEKFCIRKIILADLFPKTKHFETICLLELRK